MADLLASSDVLGPSAAAVLGRIVDRGDLPADTDLRSATARLVGPVLYLVLIAGADQARAAVQTLAADFWGRSAG